MLNVGGAELLAIALVALIALGPEQLPSVMRKLGALSNQLRSLSSGLREEFFSGLEESSRPSGSTSGTRGHRPFDPNQPIVPHGYAEQMAAERIHAEAGDPTSSGAVGLAAPDGSATLGDGARAASDGDGARAASDGDAADPSVPDPRP